MTGNEKVTEVLEIIEGSNVFVNLFFITRNIKPGIAKSAKVLNKFEFKVHGVDTDADVAGYFKNIAIDKLNRLKKKSDYSLVEYNVIDDDLNDRLYTYALNNALSFADVINNQILRGNIPKISSLSDVKTDLWAYCLRFEYDGKVAFLFRKSSSGKIMTDESRNAAEKFSSFFDSEASELKLNNRENISFDEKLDCIYINGEFLVISKNNFEQMLGLDEEFKLAAQDVLERIKSTNLVDGLTIIESEMNKSISLLRKLANIGKKRNHESLNKDELSKMHSVLHKMEGRELKLSEDGKLLIENSEDVKVFIKLLNDYYKQGMVTGKYYGTSSGQVIHRGTGE